MMSAMLYDNIEAHKNPILIDRAVDGQKRAKRPYIKASR